LPVPRLRHLLTAPVVAATVVLGLSGTAHAVNCAGADVMPSADTVVVVRTATLCLLNQERAAKGLAPLTSEPVLEGAATKYSRAMVLYRFFAHETPGGQTMVMRLKDYISGTRSWTTGENLAWGELGYATPKGTVAAWMASAGHRANILEPAFRQIGIGVALGTPTGSTAPSATYTTEFGVRTFGARRGARRGGPRGGAPAARRHVAKPSVCRKRRHGRLTRRTRRARAARCMRLSRTAGLRGVPLAVRATTTG